MLVYYIPESKPVVLLRRSKTGIRRAGSLPFELLPDAENDDARRSAGRFRQQQRRALH
jgi:hypothetical protein